MSQATLSAVEKLASRLDPEEQLALLEHLAAGLRRGLPAPGPAPRDLYGIWRGQFADDFDIDSALRAIRSDWQQDGR